MGLKEPVLFVILWSLLFCRSERLGEQLNDLIELHQNEILNLKEELASMEETAHHSNQRPTDIHVSFTSVRLFHSRHFYVIAKPAQALLTYR